VREGRRIFRNLVQSFLFLIAFHVPVIALAVAVPLLGLPPLLLPVHLVWLELIVHPVSALVFEGDRDPEAMRRPPRDPRAPILPRRPLILSLVSGALLAAASLALYAARLPLGEPSARSAAIAVVIAGGLFLVIAERGLSASVRFCVVCGVVALSLPLAIHFAPLAGLLQLGPLDAAGWAVALALAAGAVGWRRFVR
jgi:Ca2+-transporting ATPase